MEKRNPQEVFLDLLIAAMLDAAEELKLTQLQTQLQTSKRGMRIVRVIIVPEEMEYRHPDGRPFGA
jgi:hypothetical protein